MQIHGKTFVVTGGGNGIGRQIVLHLLRAGARVAAIDIDRDGLGETRRLAADARERLSLHETDITDLTAVEACLDATRTTHRAVDGLINNAGIIHPFKPVHELELDAIRRVIDVNLWGVLHMTKTFLPELLARPEAHIVNISSMAGFFPFPGQTIYGATKAAIKLLSEGMAAELASTPVGVTVVFPGAINTDLVEHSGIELDAKTRKAKENFKATSPETVARLVLRAIEHRQRYVYAGVDSKTMNVLYRLNPRLATGLVQRLMARLMPQ